MPYIKINETDYFYEIEGSGDPLVLISGYATDHTYWKQFTPYLNKNYQVVVFDNKAAGQTKDTGNKLTIEDMADDVMGIMRALKLEKPHILGFSMGSCIAQRLGYKYGSEIGKLILVSTTPKFRQATLKYIFATLTLREQGNNLNELIDIYFALTYGENTLQNKEKLEALKAEILHNKYFQSPQNGFRQYEALKAFDGTKELKSIENESIIIQGREDILFLPLEAQYMAAHMKDASFVELNYAHGIPKEAPDILSQIVSKFLSHSNVN
jgi:3-oxoadipate enol-lactonase